MAVELEGHAGQVCRQDSIGTPRTGSYEVVSTWPPRLPQLCCGRQINSKTNPSQGVIHSQNHDRNTTASIITVKALSSGPGPRSQRNYRDGLPVTPKHRPVRPDTPARIGNPLLGEVFGGGGPDDVLDDHARASVGHGPRRGTGTRQSLPQNHRHRGR